MTTTESQPPGKSLVPTIGLAIGMLLGGLAAAAIGAMLGSEPAVVGLYVGGTITGAVAGALIAKRWEARSQSQDADGTPAALEPPGQ